jgi:NADH pyrophosphatase NudC (nudix superfamily)
LTKGRESGKIGMLETGELIEKCIEREGKEEKEVRKKPAMVRT